MPRVKVEKEDLKYNIYDFQDGELCFISTNNREYHRPISYAVDQLLLRVALDKEGRLLESELIALNRWLMRRDKFIDFNHSRSKYGRKIMLTPALRQHIIGRNEV